MPRILNETDLEYKKRVIDTKSNSFCAAKWYNATIWLGSAQTTSCHHPLPHKIDEQEIKFNPKALHNTSEKKEQRPMDAVRDESFEDVFPEYAELRSYVK